MVGWVNHLGCASVALSEQHGSENGYLAAPIPVAALITAWSKEPPGQHRAHTRAAGRPAPPAGQPPVLAGSAQREWTRRWKTRLNVFRIASKAAGVRELPHRQARSAVD
ncbi:hypothetical protein ACU686_16590 [Yinghuangia aomiensis]